VYEETSNINGLNDFNLSIGNFKDLERSFGSVQKIHTRMSDLLVLQENKITTVLFGKNILFDSVGGGQVASVPEVFGSIMPLPYENGISTNPESFAVRGEEIFFTDAFRGVALRLIGNSLSEISGVGMRNYFRDMFLSNPNTRKIGGYDPYTNHYVLTSREESAVPCTLRLSRSSVVKPSTEPTGNIFGGVFYKKMFTIFTESAWTISLNDIGYGTAWVTGYPTSGVGGHNVEADMSDNNTGSTRSVQFVVEYCGGSTEVFTLYQSPGEVGTLVMLTYVNSNESEN
jgi:hypothetical protein